MLRLSGKPDAQVGDVIPDWTGETCLILAAGPSAAEIAASRDWSDIRVIVINRSYELLPYADILYGADSGFWHRYPSARAFEGLKIAPRCQRCQRYSPAIQDIIVPRDIHGNRVHELLTEPRGYVGAGGGNGAFQALNIAVQAGVACLLLGGIDYTGEHWHGPHPKELVNPTERQFADWRKRFDAAAPMLYDLEIEVFNLSKASTLKAYLKKCPAEYAAGRPSRQD